MSATKRFKNTCDRVQSFKIWSDPNMAPAEYEVQPGEEVEIPNGYAGNFIKRRAPGLEACDALPSEEEQAKLDEIAALAKEAEKLAAKEAEEAAELAKLEAEEEAKEEPKEEGLFGGLGKDKKKGKRGK